MQGERARAAREVESLEDVECLPDRRPPARGRRHPVNVIAAIGHVSRRPQRRRVARKVARGHEAGPHGEAELRVRRDRRVTHGIDDRGADRPLVERSRTVASDQPVCPREGAITEGRADGGRLPVRRQEERPRRGEGIQARQVVRDLAAEGAVDGEASLRNGDRRVQEALQRHRPEARSGDPGGEGARNADRHAARHALGEEWDRLAGSRVDERVLRKALRRRLAPIDRDHAVLTREVDDHEAASADPRDERLRHPEDGVGGDRRVDGVPALSQDPDPGRRGVGVDARDRASGSDGDCFLRRRRRRRRAGIGEKDAREPCEQQEERREPEAHERVIAPGRRSQTSSSWSSERAGVRPHAGRSAAHRACRRSGCAPFRRWSIRDPWRSAPSANLGGP